MKLRRRRLVWQLYPSFLFLILLLILTVSWFVLEEVRDFHYHQTSKDLRARTALVSEQLIGDIKEEQQLWLMNMVARLSESSATRITIVLADGRVLADSDEDPRYMDNHGQRPEILQAFAGETGVSTRFSNTLGQTLMYVALPIYQDDQLAGCVRSAMPLSDIDRTFQGIYWELLGGGVLIALLTAPLCWYLARRISRPLEQMTVGAQRFAQGDFAVTLEEAGSEESCRLAAAMNRMAVQLSGLIERETGQRAEIEAILGCMVEGLVAVDNDEQVIRMNKAAADLFEVAVDSQPERPIQEVIRQSELQHFVQRALAHEKPIEEELILPGPKQRYLHAQAAPLTGVGIERIGVLIVLHDLTRLRQLESVRRDFVANVSHELKTPITAIRGAVETLIDDDSSDPALKRFLEIIFKQNNRLNALVEDLLDLSRIEQGVIGNSWELQCVSLLPVLESARTACESLLAEKKIELKLFCSADLKARINAPLLEQAVINLLTNAIKYSDEAGRIVIEVAQLEEQVRIRVRDFGCGIEEEHLPRLFERFYRVDRARSRNLGGTGLGLAIVKHVAHAHRGEVTVASTPGEGSSFTILLPRRGE
ncbi:two-component system, OmpR family, phosphate regulon sensor histidine kinase PhoR [Malonomonas rubra DSM 5091]|uniref:histidine kinase n=1 Tax=Malonomonas rubra DSM 5091 TaxID=1122189 RepID=A0A1M6H5Y5_MALRU|nr:ATP-binding protein [Malonomonas rubra]SHJ17628.1 two-component system, OmpR family, phosphate regulon sensor histidine kinase PhoR [Malonomonas rubra DSM 5091]